jgi:hypothetical protein
LIVELILFVARYLTGFFSSFTSLFLSDNWLHVSKLGDEKPLRPDAAGSVINIAPDRVDALCQRIGANPIAAICYLSVAPEWAAPVLAVGLDELRRARIVS